MGTLYRFAVLGCGNGGMALAGQIAAKGYSVNIFEGLEFTKEITRLSEEKEIIVQGDIQSRGRINCLTNDMKVAVAGADVILVVLPAFAHEPVFRKLLPHLKDGQRVVIIPGNYGSLLLKKMLLDSGISRKITISETASLPFACRITNYKTVMVHKQKKKLKLATMPADENGAVVNIMNDIANIYLPADNVLETSLDNFNMILHPLPVLLNYGEIEKRPEEFRHYLDGITPLISQQMHKMDQERLALGKYYSLNLMSTLDQLKMYYGANDTDSIYAYVNSDESPYKNIIGHSVQSRYLTEDIPYLAVPTMLLAQQAGIHTPLLELCVKLSSQLHGTSYLESGYNLFKLGIAGLSAEDLRSYVLELNSLPKEREGVS